MDNLSDMFDRIETITSQIRTLKNKRAQRDLLHMLKTLDRALNELDKERVECRRMHRETSKYSSQLTVCKDLLNNLEKHLVYARLLYG